jgi:hypothetical protein
VEGVHFGPNVTTWQALVDAFEKAERIVDYGRGDDHATYSLTICSGEMGNLITADDTQMMDMLNTLWDCGPIDKATKKDGIQSLECPFLNMIACTTPSWISGNFPKYMIDGGLVSRIVWLYAEEKARFVANPVRIPAEAAAANKVLRRHLIEGEFKPTEEAYDWTEQWYKEHWRLHTKGMDDSRLGGFHARKQSHLYKLAMVISASRDDTRTITLKDFLDAERCVSALEQNLLGTFDRIGRSDSSNVTDRLVEFITRSGTRGVEVLDAYNYIKGSLTKQKDFDDIWKGLQRIGTLKIGVVEGRQVFIAQPRGKGD